MLPPSYTLELLDHGSPLRARASFPASFPGFDGHFPGTPILPGFCHIQLAVDCLQQLHPNTTLAAIEIAKFTRPILPNDQIILELTPAGHLAYDANLSVSGETCSRFHLTLRPGPNPQDTPAS